MFVLKYLSLEIKKYFEKSNKASILFVGPNKSLMFLLCKDLPIYNVKNDYSEFINEFISKISLPIGDDVYGLIIDHISNENNLYVIGGYLAYDQYIGKITNLTSIICDLFPLFNFYYNELGIENLEQCNVSEADHMVLQDRKYGIISCDNPITNKHWARMTGEQRILIAKLHQIRKEKFIKIDENKVISRPIGF